LTSALVRKQKKNEDTQQGDLISLILFFQNTESKLRRKDWPVSAVYGYNRREHTDAPYGQDAHFWIVSTSSGYFAALSAARLYTVE
jgi:hypothetical protein